MNDFFAPAIPAENVLSDRLRTRLVAGDGMAPVLRQNWDYVLLAPVNTYVGEGIYLIEIGGGEALYRVQNIMGGKLLLKFDNPLYSSQHIFTKQEFEEIVLAYVVADIKVRDDRFLRNLAPVDNGEKH